MEIRLASDVPDALDDVDELLNRVWEDLIGRSTGPANLRLLIQPGMATIIGIRAGLKDAREGRPPFLWAVTANRADRRELLRQGWKDIGNLFALALVLDSIYQLIVQRAVFVLELLVVATTLAIVPYVLVRGPVTRFGNWLARRMARGR